MPKKKRVWYPGAVYHIMSRGNRKSDIFQDEEDFYVYLMILRKTREKYPYSLYAYCLMTNHVHLQIETKDAEIWHIMRTINLCYTKYFNNKYNFIGHLFQGRYVAELIENDAYNIQASRYIHLNPVKAGMVASPIDYRWSSYGVYMGRVKNDMVTDQKILSYFQNNRELYQESVEEYRLSPQFCK